MQTIVFYASKTGASKTYAEAIARTLGNCALANLQEAHPNFDDYDLIIIGSGVRLAKAYKTTRTFLKKELPMLLQKKTAIYLCNGEPASFEQSVANSIPQELQASAVGITCLKGTEPFKQADGYAGWMDQAALDAFIERVRGV